MKKTLLPAIIILAFAANANAAKSAVKMATEKYEVGVDNVVSGAVITLASILEEKMNRANAADKKKYNNFKRKLNAKLKRDSINQKIYFKTNNSEIDSSVKSYISNMILSLNDYKKLKFSLNGYSDARGEEDVNLSLSGNRTSSVLKILQSLDIPKANIKINNFGETKSGEHMDLEDYFFDRKVEIIIKR